MFNKMNITMMRRIRYYVLALVFAVSGILNARADEGMWLPYLLDQIKVGEMQKMGLKLTAEDIYSINQSSLKDAIVLFGRGCTGEVISAEGLLLTNHHCGYGSIQSVSSVGNDYLSQGFWATSLREEIPIPGLTVQFLKSVKDVSEEMLQGVFHDMTEKQRDSVLDINRKKILDEASSEDGYSALVREFYSGNEFYLLVYQTFRDIRFVGAPPSSIGKFGADTDNWMWPRHTGDFAIFRVYTGPNGKPANYQVNNIPYKAERFLTINAAGVEKDDFAMILGYPGRTDRYLTSWGIDLAINETNPSVVDLRRKKLDIIGEDMAGSDEIRIKYASKYAGISNYWKYFIGQTRGLKRLRVADKKRETEASFAEWVKLDPIRKSRYEGVLTDFAEAYNHLRTTAKASVYIREAGFGPEIVGFSQRFDDLVKTINTKGLTLKDKEKAIARAKETAEAHFKNYHPDTDRKLLAAMLKMYAEDLDPAYVPDFIKKAAKKHKGDWDAYARWVFARSVFASPQAFGEFQRKPSAKKLTDDPAYQIAKAFRGVAIEIEARNQAANEKLSRARRLFLAGLREMQPEKLFYPDANQTLRLTYGTVQDYEAADAMNYHFYTTHYGILEKEDPTNWEFTVPARLKELFYKKDFKPYAQGDTLKVCFLTTHDITGGNSGSPVLNGKGELIGLAFDGNWEAMSGDIAYEPLLQRTINVDIRYVLFIIDKFARSHHIMRELSIRYEK